MISFDEMLRYILILREEGMENNYKLSEDQIKLIKKVENAYKNNSELKDKLDKMAKASSMGEIFEIYNGKKVENHNLEVFKQETVFDKEDEKLQNKEKQLTLVKPVNNKKAGYVDALVMALVTGFIGGISTMIIFIMIK